MLVRWQYHSPAEWAIRPARGELSAMLLVLLIIVGGHLSFLAGAVGLGVYFELRRRKRIAQGLFPEDPPPQGFEVVAAEPPVSKNEKP
jgi:hypothetical protein